MVSQPNSQDFGGSWMKWDSPVPRTQISGQRKGVRRLLSLSCLLYLTVPLLLSFTVCSLSTVSFLLKYLLTFSISLRVLVPSPSTLFNLLLICLKSCQISSAMYCFFLSHGQQFAANQHWGLWGMCFTPHRGVSHKTSSERGQTWLSERNHNCVLSNCKERKPSSLQKGVTLQLFFSIQAILHSCIWFLRPVQWNHNSMALKNWL